MSKVLIITRSDDNASIDTVSTALRERGATPIRLDSDRYPDLVRLTTCYDGSTDSRRLRTPDADVDLADLDAVWYRRFHAAKALPVEILGDTWQASVQESRRTLLGSIAALPCFHLDPLESVRRTDHKELQLRRAAALGLSTPRTLFSNDEDEVRAFFEALDGKMITKMQHSFAIYRSGIENVVFTNRVERADLDDLSGLRYCPMTFQEHIDKHLELRVTVVGRKVLSAAIDSQQRLETTLDWRRDGVGLMENWTPYRLPPEVTSKLLRLVAEFGLNYAACDFILTPQGEHIFLEINAVGEFFWLESCPGLPISDAIADVLLDPGCRQPLALEAWRNYAGSST